MMGSASNALRLHKPTALSIPDTSGAGALQLRPGSAGLSTPTTISPPGHRAAYANFASLGLIDVPRDIP
ncbi:hypothetical protein GGI03_004244, partial [Coemansia sp. RSA 2337]